MANTQTGRVKSLKAGFGFLKMDTGEDVFFLPTVMDKSSGQRFDDLQTGQRVEAEVITGDRGLRATYVRVVEG